MESQPRLLDQMREVLRLKHRSFWSPLTARATLDDVVSQNPPIRDARWHPARKHLLSKVLDSLLRVSSRPSSSVASHQTARQAVLDNIPSSSTEWDGTGRLQVASSWQRLVLDSGRSSSPAGGPPRRVASARCRP